MKLTNNSGLPEAFVRAVKNDPYSKGDADFSVTELLKPPRARALEIKYKDEIIEDARDRVWAVLGQSVHYILMQSARDGDIVERRFSSEFLGMKVAGQIDLLETDTKTLSDWKVTKAYPFTKKGGSGLKDEWVAQLNMQLELLRGNGLDATRLQIVGILKDFDEAKTKVGSKRFELGYPKAEIVAVEMPMWDRERTQAFIKQRVRAHHTAARELPLCGAEETWGGRRCARYCPASAFCDQYQSALKTGILTQGAIT